MRARGSLLQKDQVKILNFTKIQLKKIHMLVSVKKCPNNPILLYEAGGRSSPGVGSATVISIINVVVVTRLTSS